MLSVTDFCAGKLNKQAMDQLKNEKSLNGHQIQEVEKVHLINGTFAPSDARKILLDMLHNKINFHNRQIQIIQEQSSGDTSHSEKRIDELFDLTEKVKIILAEAEKNDRKVVIECPLILSIQ